MSQRIAPSEWIAQAMSDFLQQGIRQPEVNGYRNGYKPGRIRSAEGEIPLAVPQVRGPVRCFPRDPAPRRERGKAERPLR